MQNANKAVRCLITFHKNCNVRSLTSFFACVASPALDPYTAALNEDSRAFAGQDVSEMMEWALAERLGLGSRPRVANKVYEEVWEGFEEPVGEEERTARAARAAAGEENRGVIW